MTSNEKHLNDLLDQTLKESENLKTNLLERINVLRHILPLDILNNQGNDTSRVLNEMEDIINDIK